MLSDPIGDMLTRIRNGFLSKKEAVSVPYSKMKEELAKLFVFQGYLKSIKKDTSGNSIQLTLNYVGNNPTLEKIIRISKPGLKIYSGYQELKKISKGRGKLIISTSKGIMTGKEAQKNKLGGEVICKIW